MHRHLLTSALVLVAACGSSAKAPKPADPADPAKALVWKDMNADQRKKFMEDVVMPKAKAVFVAFDPKFEKMDCKTCHGAGVDTGHYEMPNPQIKPLPNSEAAFMAWLGKDPEAARYTPFMAEKVEPMMAELLHMTPFDPKTMTGELGCQTCHTLIDAEGKPFTPPKLGHDHAH